jgi:ADP-ribosylglycohydrolase
LTYAFAGSSTSRGLQVQWKEDIVRNAIALGGDVDTMGRNCGSVLGVPDEIEFKKE